MEERVLTDAEREVTEIRRKIAGCGGLFEYHVRELQNMGIPPGRAVECIARTLPAVHEDFLRRAANGQAGSLIGGTGDV